LSVVAFSEIVRILPSSKPSSAIASISTVTRSHAPAVEVSGARISSARFLKSEA